MHLDKFKLYDIAEKYMELINPFSSEKIITIGRFLNLKKDDRVIEFGSGFAEILGLWAESFGTKGIGIDIREHACERAQKKITERNLNDRIRIECIDGSKFKYEVVLEKRS
jgi:cyclopropane fatty-acyl-phospholipid synthase-like methyltransferase